MQAGGTKLHCIRIGAAENGEDGETIRAHQQEPQSCKHPLGKRGWVTLGEDSALPLRGTQPLRGARCFGASGGASEASLTKTATSTHY